MRPIRGYLHLASPFGQVAGLVLVFQHRESPTCSSFVLTRHSWYGCISKMGFLSINVVLRLWKYSPPPIMQLQNAIFNPEVSISRRRIKVLLAPFMIAKRKNGDLIRPFVTAAPSLRYGVGGAALIDSGVNCRERRWIVLFRHPLSWKHTSIKVWYRSSYNSE